MSFCSTLFNCGDLDVQVVEDLSNEFNLSYFDIVERAKELNQGEFIAVRSAGAYGFTMASNYNSRPRAAEVIVKGDKYSIVRERETYDELIRGESVKF